MEDGVCVQITNTFGEYKYCIFLSNCYVHTEAFGKLACGTAVAAVEGNLMNCVKWYSCFSNGIPLVMQRRIIPYVCVSLMVSVAAVS